MGKFEKSEKIGLRDKETNKIIAVYPSKPQGSNAEIERAVRDWYYKQDCGAEEEMRNAYVDNLSESELNSYQ